MDIPTPFSLFLVCWVNFTRLVTGLMCRLVHYVLDVSGQKLISAYFWFTLYISYLKKLHLGLFCFFGLYFSSSLFVHFVHC